MKNYNAEKINKRLDVNLFNENNQARLELNKFTKKQVRELMIDDLIQNGKGTERLALFVKDILLGEKS